MIRNRFNLSHTRKQTGNMGMLMPCSIFEAEPGDTIDHSISMLLRFAPLATPVMHRVDMRLHTYFVPFRLCWDGGPDDSWEAFYTAGDDGLAAPTRPTIELEPADMAIGSLANYLGIKPSASNKTVDAKPFRAVGLVWNEHYRDTQLQDPRVVDLTGGADTTTDLSLPRIAWEKDRFAGARKEPFLGPEPTIPLGDSAPVVINGTSGVANSQLIRSKTTGALVSADSNLRSNNAGQLFEDLTDTEVTLDINSTHFADLQNASSASLREYRVNLAIARNMEERNMYGSRYTEVLAARGVRAQDMRLNRPELIGVGSNIVQFSEVLSSSAIDGEPSPGQMFGHGIGGVRSHRYRYFVREHGYIITFVSVRPKTVYASGRNRLWDRASRFDHVNPEFFTVGQQPIYNREVYQDHSSPNGVFGWEPIYDDFRHIESDLAGEFLTTLDDWTLARIFDSDVALNESFIECDPDTRIFQSTATDQMYMNIRHAVRAKRLIPPSTITPKTV